MVDTTNLTKLIKTPNQASTIFGLDGNTIPRKKSLFYVRFVPNGTGSPPSWQNNLGFVVKHIDRPSIQPEIETMNQYNKKRQITKGFKINPMKITLYDTADSLVMRMWNDYSRWYFGDFGQGDNDQFKYDITSDQFYDNGAGYGYVPQNLNNVSLDLNSQFFFSRIEVYQVFGGYYTQFDLVNPKINSFDPDDLDYEQTTVSTISLSVMYEAIQYRNNNVPTKLDTSSSPFSGQFNGQTLNVVGAPVRKHGFSSDAGNTPSMNTSTNISLPQATASFLSNSTTTQGSGALNNFGSYNFGSLSPSNSISGNTTGDLSYMSLGNNQLSTSLNLPNNIPSSLATGVQPINQLSAAQFDVTTGALDGAGGTGSPYSTNYLNQQLAGGVMASSMLDNNSPSDQLVAPTQVTALPTLSTSNPIDTSGLTLNSQSMAIVNAQRDPTSQIGLNQTTDTQVIFNSASSLSDLQTSSLNLGSAISGNNSQLTTLTQQQTYYQAQMSYYSNQVNTGNSAASASYSQYSSLNTNITNQINTLNATISDQNSAKAVVDQQIALQKSGLGS